MSEIVTEMITEKPFRRVSEDWLRSIRGKVAFTTYDRYYNILNRDIYPEYSDLLMKDMTVEEMNRFLRLVPDKAKESGRTMSEGSVLMIKTVLSSIIRFAEGSEQEKEANISHRGKSYEALTSSELELLVLHAKKNHCPEMLAALLSTYCGMRVGELSALECDDVDMDRAKIYVHQIVHRVKNPNKNASNKTIIVVEELPRKNQIRTVVFPEILKEYIEEFMLPGRRLIRNHDDGHLDMRTLENRLNRIMKNFIDGINFERLRKTYVSGGADIDILNNIFLGI